MLVAASLATLSAQELSFGVKTGANFSSATIGANIVTPKVKLATQAGFYVGAVGGVMFNDKFGVQTELLYSTGGSQLGLTDEFGTMMNNIVEYTMQGSEDPVPDMSFINDLNLKYKTQNLYIPILARYQATPALSLLAGTYFNIGLSSKFEMNSNAESLLAESGMDYVINPIMDAVDGMIKNFDCGLAFGLEYAFSCGFFVEGRYNLGLVNKMKSTITFPAGTGEFVDDTSFDLDKEFGITPKLKNQFFQVGVGYRF